MSCSSITFIRSDGGFQIQDVILGVVDECPVQDLSGWAFWPSDVITESGDVYFHFGTDWHYGFFLFLPVRGRDSMCSQFDDVVVLLLLVLVNRSC